MATPLSNPTTNTASIEEGILAHAEPLLPAVNPAQELLDNGVCRINNVISQETCIKLKQRVLDLAAADDPTIAPTDFRCIPQTRLRFSEPWKVPLNNRIDLLLPVEDPLINEVLQELAASMVGSVLTEVASTILPPRRKPGSTTTIAKSTHSNTIELVEVASLVSYPGATNQVVHADFHRHHTLEQQLTQDNDRLPPRLVTFLYLQDTPTIRHGPTIFLPGTNNHEAHTEFYKKDDNKEVSKIITPASVLMDGVVKAATLECGSCAIYDASLLHFGSANSVPENTRAVFYFGVSLLQEQEELEQDQAVESPDNGNQQQQSVLQHLYPIQLGPIATTSTGKESSVEPIMRFTHPSLLGML